MPTSGVVFTSQNQAAAEIGGRSRTHSVPTADGLRHELPLPAAAAASVRAGRLAIRGILRRTDDRLLVVTGPCSIHDVNAGLVYAQLLDGLRRELDDDLVLAMRVYVEKPRTRAGWTGLLCDPRLDGSLDVSQGLRHCRALMLQVAEMGLPLATEWLNPQVPPYLADVVSWGSIGARTVESQIHRQMASGLPMPVGMKNSSTGSVRAAIDAVCSAAAPHGFLGVAPDGRVMVLHTSGNPDCHVVLRGADDRVNHRTRQVRDTVRQLADAGLPSNVVIDASHGVAAS